LKGEERGRRDEEEETQRIEIEDIKETGEYERNMVCLAPLLQYT
jgi:hypothetical protein